MDDANTTTTDLGHADRAALIARARAEGKWIWCAYQDLWWSPDGLAEDNRRGRFRWGAQNFTLRDPAERLAEAQRRVDAAVAERDRIAAKIAAGRP